MNGGSASVTFTAREVDSLVRVADFYLTIRPLRPLVRLTAPAAIRRRYRYIAQESRWLKRFAREVRTDIRARKQDKIDIEMTIPALVGFWGRILASLNSRRAVRRMTREEFEVRQALSERLCTALGQVTQNRKTAVEEQLATRRPSEEVRMRQQLGLPARPGMDLDA